MTVSVLWFRRDLRLGDHPALLESMKADARVVPVFVLDQRLLGHRTPRTERLFASLADLHETTDGRLVVRSGDPRTVIPDLAREVGASSVHVSRETTPFGRRRDEAVEAALATDGRHLVATGTPYAVGPGRIRTGAGTAYKVFTPFARAWREHGWPGPAPHPGAVRWASGVDSEILPRAATSTDSPAVGEAAALARWRTFLDERLADYRTERDRPDLDTTSRLSIPLKYGEIHPRTLLAEVAAHDAAGSAGAETFTTELAWREFYADVLWENPDSAWHDLRDNLTHLPYDRGPETDRLVDAWREGRTGYPFVDAGMRQLLAEGWMHNRLRMVTASFLTKDLHVWWPVGARHFLDHLLDGDIASNNHGWQWVAGTGTDAAPYFRVFNPVKQGLRFDPDGGYVRRWIPELRHLEGAAAHEPWRSAGGLGHGYPERIVDHDQERRETLARHESVRGRNGPRA
ncbi:deoxyribodipyrimidine photo-lyase [Knoellia sinensis KCTC 19936]|uniref:Deoxyribodipyrimidine photo-lyase n=1 Tax=Knoellia sinensis KCTC 19936 TaxID=1385520 RepID=A0A0A0J1P8_9MICO|nr:deoxyribodipyrimidine photo-lyase [Knoellia sinensis]KGN31345.1 deoxyribodipyrimidine photo-lyase [Knoellia sinensis KCTC 19936]